MRMTIIGRRGGIGDETMMMSVTVHEGIESVRSLLVAPHGIYENMTDPLTIDAIDAPHVLPCLLLVPVRDLPDLQSAKGIGLEIVKAATAPESDIRCHRFHRAPVISPKRSETSLRRRRLQRRIVFLTMIQIHWKTLLALFLPVQTKSLRSALEVEEHTEQTPATLMRTLHLITTRPWMFNSTMKKRAPQVDPLVAQSQVL